MFITPGSKDRQGEKQKLKTFTYRLHGIAY